MEDMSNTVYKIAASPSVEKNGPLGVPQDVWLENITSNKILFELYIFAFHTTL